MQKARRHPDTYRGSDRLRAHGFRFCFTPLSTVLFTFPSRYSSTIGLPVVFSLSGWCRTIQPGFLRSRPTQDTLRRADASHTGLSPSAARLPRRFRSLPRPMRGSYNPDPASTGTVWAYPLSLAATRGITVVFSSSAYLDVSVRRVCLPARAGISRKTGMGCPIRTPADLPPLRVPADFRSLARPSSPPGA